MKKRMIWTVAAVAYVCFIFSNSMTPAVESSRQSSSVLLMVHMAIASMGFSAEWITEHLIRKCAHFAEYFLLGIIMGQSLDSYGMKRERRVFLHIITGFIVPFLDETIQIFVAGRSSQVSDVWLDCAGVFAGSAALYAVKHQYRKRQEIKIVDEKRD